MNDDFRDLLAAFVAESVRFVVVGAHALAAHGVPRTTGDLDVLVDPTTENAERVWKALAVFGAPLNEMRLRAADFTAKDAVVQLGMPPYRIDIMTGITGVTFADAWNDRIESEMFGVKVSLLGRATLMRNKRATGRPRDLTDVAALGG